MLGQELAEGFIQLTGWHRRLKNTNHISHLGTLGTGNHFIEVCLDTADGVWLMLHSGSRGVGNAIARIYIDHARGEMERQGIELPDRDLAYLEEGSEAFEHYIVAVDWAQRYARLNRHLMMEQSLHALHQVIGKERSESSLSRIV